MSTLNAAEKAKLENEYTEQTKIELYLDEAHKLLEMLEEIPMLVESQQVSLYI
jgi:hypothetical protein